MMVYEVYVRLDPSIQEQWLAWIRPHIKLVLATGCFTAGQLERVVDPIDDRPAFRVRYYFEHLASLRRYEAEHAPALRAEGIKLFEDRMTADRSVLEILSVQEVSRGS